LQAGEVEVAPGIVNGREIAKVAGAGGCGEAVGEALVASASGLVGAAVEVLIGPSYFLPAEALGGAVEEDDLLRARRSDAPLVIKLGCRSQLACLIL
jgi:hypothetical protein